MICTECRHSTTVYKHGGMYFECAAIRAMNLPLTRNNHQSWQVMVYFGNVFIPKECIHPDVLPNRGAGFIQLGSRPSTLTREVF